MNPLPISHAVNDTAPLPMTAIFTGRNTAKKEMTTQIMDITPSQAERWLLGNLRNRPLHEPTVEKYAADMLAGEWTLTHQGIAFSPEGTLVDGQHRLNAIVKAGVTVRMTVAFNVPAEAFFVVDQNRRRKVEDVLTMLGSFGAVGKNEMAILRAMVSGLSSSGTTWTHAEAREHYARHGAAVQFARDLQPGSIRFITAPVRACFARAYYCVDHEKIRSFYTALATGVAPEGGEAIGLLSRTFIANAGRITSPSARSEVYGRTCRALYAYVNGEKITKLYVPAHELFELPA